MTAEKQPFPLGHGAVTATSRHGQVVQIRHILPEDAALLIDLYNRLSPETRRLRFMAPRPELPAEVLWPEAMRLSHINPLVQAALIGIVREAEQDHAVAVARLIRDDDEPTTAEVAIVLRDDYQRQGVGTLLFDLLLQVALVRGLKRLRAVTLAENVAMQQLVRKSGLPFTAQTSHGEMTLMIALSNEPTEKKDTQKI
jgi:acetyltransferase